MPRSKNCKVMPRWLYYGILVTIIYSALFIIIGGIVFTTSSLVFSYIFGHASGILFYPQTRIAGDIVTSELFTSSIENNSMFLLSYFLIMLLLTAIVGFIIGTIIGLIISNKKQIKKFFKKEIVRM